mmetsp:Transcript_11624/g.34817  ORF Transcript_11624/g.34817 Transcript_11624/m.34817 type:complete len:224 (+) Transcript_11624:3136-3807(+)
MSAVFVLHVFVPVVVFGRSFLFLFLALLLGLVGVRLGLGGTFLLLLVHFFGRVLLVLFLVELVALENVGGELVLHVDGFARAAGDALMIDDVVFYFVVRLGQFTRRAQHELFDVHAQLVLQHLRRVRPVHDRALRVLGPRRLRPQLAPEKFRHLARPPMQRRRHLRHVRHRRLDPVPPALHLPDQPRHLVPVLGVLDRRRPRDVQQHRRHLSSCVSVLVFSRD